MRPGTSLILIALLAMILIASILQLAFRI